MLRNFNDSKITRISEILRNVAESIHLETREKLKRVHSDHSYQKQDQAYIL